MAYKYIQMGDNIYNTRSNYCRRIENDIHREC